MAHRKGISRYLRTHLDLVKVKILHLKLKELECPVINRLVSVL